MVICDNKTNRHDVLSGLRYGHQCLVVLLFLSSLAMFAVTANAQTGPDPGDRMPTLMLSQPRGVSDTVEYATHLIDPSRALRFEQLRDPAGRPVDFAPIPGGNIDFGYNKGAVWLQLAMFNDTERTHDWVMRFHENFKQEFDMWVVGPQGQAAHVLHQARDSGFDTRPLPFAQLAAPFRLSPGEGATIFIRFWSEGTTLLPISILSEIEFATLSGKVAARNFVFYGIIGTIILAAAVGAAFFRNVVAATFAGYLGFALLFVMHSDGTGFQYLYDRYPGFNSIASVVWGGGFIFFSALYARTFLRTRHDFPKVDIWLRAIMAAVVLLWLGMLVSDRHQIKLFFVILSLIAILSCLGASLIVARRHFREVRFYVFGWSAAVGSSLLLNLIHVFGLEVNPEIQTNTMRGAMAIDALFMGLAIVDRYNQMRLTRQEALQASLSAAQRNLVLTRRMTSLEQQLDILDTAARQRDEAFANTIHDLRQPLHALRLRVLGEADGRLAEGNEREKTNSSFDYLETLISQHLAEFSGPLTEPVVEVTDTTGDITLDHVLTGVYEMFLPDARDKGLDFRMVSTSATTSVPPLVLMRVVSNLVSNAIRYTETGRVLLGCRRRGYDIRIEVHDSGPGLDDRQFARACGRDVRLVEANHPAKGSGYGLAIVASLARDHGGALERVTICTTGLGIGVRFPADKAIRRAAAE